jgi:hypothetical protein
MFFNEHGVPHFPRVTSDDGAVLDVSLEGQLDGPVVEPRRDYARRRALT